MLWVLERFGLRDAAKDRLFACWCVRHTPLLNGGSVWDLLVDPRSRRAVEVAERFARRQASIEERDSAWAAACWAATEFWVTGTTQESAAAAAATWVVAVSDMERAAESAAAAAGATDTVLRVQADYVLAIYGNPFAISAESPPSRNAADRPGKEIKISADIHSYGTAGQDR
jgi:hypothetical protein